MNQFYIILPSNSQLTNTAAMFETLLPINVNLQGEWEVGLAEIIYPYTWYNIFDKKCFINLDFDMKNVNVKIPSGYYDTVEDLIERIQQVLAEEGGVDEQEFKFVYKKDEKRVEIIFDTTHLNKFLISPFLSYILGFPAETTKTVIVVDERHAILEAEYSPDIAAGMHHLYIYCDILQPQIIGDKQVPLLQVIAVEGKFLKTVTRSFVHPHYVPVLKQSFSSIEINIKNDANEPIPFQFGNTIIKLHFRKIYK